MRTKRILERLHPPVATQVRFGQHDEDDPAGPYRTFLTLDEPTWEWMERPDQLTVTIEPGDRLNE